MKVAISNFPWGKPKDAPVSNAEIIFHRTHISINMCSYEKNIKASIKEDNGEVYKDSCLEFFFSPCPSKSNSYFNFECNPLGTLYIGFSKSGEKCDSYPIDFSEFKELINIEAYIDDIQNLWGVSYSVPYNLIKKYCPDFLENNQKYIKGNFYKCGDETITPHFAVWGNIDADKIKMPNFHVVEYFKDILIDFVD